jgi:simple sugar transport system ATP-binding protein
MSFSIADNLVLNDYYHPPYASGLRRNEAAVRADAEQAIAKYDVRTPSAMVSTGTLSGGNQQKVIVAREFEGDIKLLVLDQPTRGLDVGSIEFIHRQAIARRDTGVAILLVSAELDEVLELSDRIAVMYRGQIVEVLDGRTADKEDVGLLMATGGRESGIQEPLAETAS